MILWAVLAIIVGIAVQQLVIRKAEQYAAARAECEKRGHEYTEVFDALDNPHWPTRICRRCKHQDNLVRCPCGNLVCKLPPYKILDEGK